MRFLVVGAGATGGYFGGRLLEAGCDITFLVRPARAERLAATGLIIASPAGDVTLRSPPTVLASDLQVPFDTVILSCKAYDLDSAIESFAPAVGAGTAIVPLLNGMRHFDTLDARFGADRVLGGSCFITAKLTDAGQKSRPASPPRPLRLLLSEQLDRIRAAIGAADDFTLSSVANTRGETLAARIIHGLYDEAKHQGEMYLIMKLCP